MKKHLTYQSREEGMPKEKKYSHLPARQKSETLLTWLADHKGKALSAFDLAGSSPVTDVVLIASASSARHARSLADGLLELCSKENYEFLRMEGYQEGQWILADLNDIVVHIFQEPVRELYNLEGLWRHAVPFSPECAMAHTSKGITL